MNFSRSGLFHRKTRVVLKYFVHACNFDLPVIVCFSFLNITASSFSSGLKALIPDVVFLQKLLCAFNYLPNGKYSNLFNAAAFFRKSFSIKTFLPVKNSYLLIFPDDKAEILAVCLSDLCFAQFYY